MEPGNNPGKPSSSSDQQGISSCTSSTWPALVTNRKHIKSVVSRSRLNAVTSTTADHSSPGPASCSAAGSTDTRIPVASKSIAGCDLGAPASANARATLVFLTEVLKASKILILFRRSNAPAQPRRAHGTAETTLHLTPAGGCSGLFGGTDHGTVTT